MNTAKTKLGIVGCGNIAQQYCRNLTDFNTFEVVGVSDVVRDKAKNLAQEIKCSVYNSLENLLANNEIECIVNLSIHHAHYEIIKKCLQAGKHVYTEKPLAMTYKNAKELLELAQSKNLVLASSPFTFLNPAQQAALSEIQSGKLGNIRVVYAEVNWARIETWHPNPQPFYEVGPMWDVGIYPLTIIGAFLGSILRVNAFSSKVYPNRQDINGKKFTIKNDDYITAILELESGGIVRITTNFYVGHNNKQGQGIEFHGDKGSLYLSSWFFPDASVEYAPYGSLKESPYTKVTYTTPVEREFNWLVGVADTVNAIREKSVPKVSAVQAAHIVEVIEAIHQSSKTNKGVDIYSRIN